MKHATSQVAQSVSKVSYIHVDQNPKFAKNDTNKLKHWVAELQRPWF